MFGIEDLIYVRDIDNFNQIKQPALDAIDGMNVRQVNHELLNICNTDWFMHKDIKRPYIDIISPAIDNHIDNMKSEFGYDIMVVKNYWFQQYQKGDWHSKHTHPDVSFSNVMFIELPESSVSTIFYFKNKQFRIDCKEGQIISFPGMLIHSSPPNHLDKRKTSVVFNTLAEA